MGTSEIVPLLIRARLEAAGKGVGLSMPESISTTSRTKMTPGGSGY